MTEEGEKNRHNQGIIIICFYLMLVSYPPLLTLGSLLLSLSSFTRDTGA